MCKLKKFRTSNFNIFIGDVIWTQVCQFCDVSAWLVPHKLKRQMYEIEVISSQKKWQKNREWEREWVNALGECENYYEIRLFKPLLRGVVIFIIAIYLWIIFNNYYLYYSYYSVPRKYNPFNIYNNFDLEIPYSQYFMI